MSSDVKGAWGLTPDESYLIRSTVAEHRFYKMTFLKAMKPNVN